MSRSCISFVIWWFRITSKVGFDGKLSHFYLLCFSNLLLSNHRSFFLACECYPSVGIKKISSVLILDFVDTKGLDVSIYSLFLAISHVLHALVESRRDYIIVVQPGPLEQCLVRRVGIDNVELRLWLETGQLQGQDKKDKSLLTVLMEALVGWSWKSLWKLNTRVTSFSS